ncbi:MAG: phosphatidylserine decarboxylase family protein [Fidelibacterota bacterium]
MPARDGMRILVVSFLLAFGLLMMEILARQNWILIIFWAVFLFFLFALWFFRDPERQIPDGDHLILSPADGRVVAIGELEDDFVGRAKRVSIFMSILDVHVNRIPLSGTVRAITHRPGRFRPAMQPAASFENENTEITLENEQTRLKFAQVAGMLARRIVCRLQVGQSVQAGERFGMIKFGSRVDMTLPETVKLQVRIGDRVKAGKTVIGEFE